MKYLKRLNIVLIALVVSFTPIFNTEVNAASPITEYPLVSNPCPPNITTGSDGALWFTQACSNKIGRITTSGTLTQFGIPTANAYLVDIVSGSDGALWFTEADANKIGRITTSGVVTEYSVPTASAGLSNITTGPDGALWFTENGSNKIGRITTTGSISEYPLLTGSTRPFGITAGSDGALWFTESKNDINYVARITTSGVITSEFPVTTPNMGISNITSGPDGALWATDYGNKIYRITLSGTVTAFTLSTPSALTFTNQITTGSDGALWFTEYVANKIGRITTSGVINEFQIATNSSHPSGIVSGPDNTIWFTEYSGNKIGRLNLTNLTLNSLSAESPAQRPHLRWVESPDATSYNVYRDGVLIGSSLSAEYIDTAAMDGNHGYYITAVGPGGEGSQSNTVTVLVEHIASPSGLEAITPTKSSPALTWNGAVGADHYDIYRDGSKIDSSITTNYVDNSTVDGSHTYFVKAVTPNGTVSDQSNTITIIYDTTGPITTNGTLTGGVISLLGIVNIVTGPSTITANATDSLTGVTSGEYFIDTDPGQGMGAAMTYANGKVTGAMSSTGLVAGSNYTIHVRARDAAGNWGVTTTIPFTYL